MFVGICIQELCAICVILTLQAKTKWIRGSCVLFVSDNSEQCLADTCTFSHNIMNNKGMTNIENVNIHEVVDNRKEALWITKCGNFPPRQNGQLLLLKKFLYPQEHYLYCIFYSARQFYEVMILRSATF